MKSIGLAAFFLVYGCGMYLLGSSRHASPEAAAYAALLRAEHQTEGLAIILSGAKTLPTRVSGGDWRDETEAWRRTADALGAWRQENPQNVHENLAVVAQADCMAVLDLLKSSVPGNDVAEAVCSRSMEKSVARNTDLLGILLAGKPKG